MTTVKSFDYFAIIPTSLHSTRLVKNATTGPPGASFKLIQRTEALPGKNFTLTLSSKPLLR